VFYNILPGRINGSSKSTEEASFLISGLCSLAKFSHASVLTRYFQSGPLSSCHILTAATDKTKRKNRLLNSSLR